VRVRVRVRGRVRGRVRVRVRVRFRVWVRVKIRDREYAPHTQPVLGTKIRWRRHKSEAATRSWG
jgi:hypothetical protein